MIARIQMYFSAQHVICINILLHSAFRNLYVKISREIYEANLDLPLFYNSFNLNLLPNWKWKCQKLLRRQGFCFKFSSNFIFVLPFFRFEFCSEQAKISSFLLIILFYYFWKLNGILWRKKGLPNMHSYSENAFRNAIL